MRGSLGLSNIRFHPTRKHQVTTRAALNFCARTRSVLKDFNLYQGSLETKGKKFLMNRLPATIRELLLRNADIMDGNITLDMLFASVKEYEQAFVITSIHNEVKIEVQRSAKFIKPKPS